MTKKSPILGAMWIVTGATGFIGSAFVWELNQNGIDNLILADHVSPSERGGVLKKRKYKEFLSAEELLTRTADPDWAREIEGVVHMGACSTTTETDEAYLQKNNVEYTQALFSFCAGRNIPLIYASSGACYGDGSFGFDDTKKSEVYKPLNLYGWSKLKFDIWAAQQKITPPRWYGLRFFNVYGPNEYHKGEMSSVVFKASKQIRDTGRLKLFKSHNPDYRDGEQLRDFVYVKDITRWMLEIIQNPKIESGIYNMGFGKSRTWIDLARYTFAGMEKPMQIDWIEVPENIRNQYQYFTEAKIDRLLGQGLSAPRWSLELGISDYVKNYLSQPDPHL